MVTSSSDQVGAGSPTGPSSLHIGWWRNGFHEYEPTKTKPTERQIRKRGASVAASICLAWMALGAACAFVLWGIGSEGYPVPLAGAVSALAALPVASALGWRLAPLALKSRKSFMWLVVGVVVLTDVEIALICGLVVAFLDNAITGVAIFALGTPIGFVYFGLPGLAMAVPSAWYWEHVMRRTHIQHVE